MVRTSKFFSFYLDTCIYLWNKFKNLIRTTKFTFSFEDWILRHMLVWSSCSHESIMFACFHMTDCSLLIVYNTGNGHKNIVYWLEIINTSMSVDKEASIPIWLTFIVLNMNKEYQEISVHVGVNLLNICLQTLCLSYTSHMILSVFTDILLITGHCL